ncbi:MAG: transposase, partial [Chitinispirillaceae bacterium]|nr:transposase [Chitinispirillaceae bacterium]
MSENYNWENGLLLNPPTFSKIAVSYQAILNAGDFSKLEDVLMERLDAAPEDIAFYLPAYRAFIRKQDEKRASAFLGLHVESLMERHDLASEIILLQAILGFWQDGEYARDLLLGHLKTMYSDSSNFERYVKHLRILTTTTGADVLRLLELWLRYDEGRIDRETVAMIKSWRHTGFSVDNSVRIASADHDGMQRLVEYIARCPFSLTRMVSLTDDGKILYRASKPGCIPFPKQGDPELDIGMPRNYEIFDPLDFLAAVTQHIPDKGEHQIRYYGWYSNKRRGMQGKRGKPVAPVSGTYGPDEYWEKLESDTSFRKKCRMTWAALIKCVFEVDPLKCPKCGGTMKVLSFIERHQSDVIEKILRHCGLWKEFPPRAP